MSFSTKAAIVRHPGEDFRFEDVTLDGPRAGEVIVRMVACGICHTDLAARDGLFGLAFPAVFGHEGAGVVEKVGSGVTRAAPGDGVVLSFNSCGRCSGCLGGHPSRCREFDVLNFGDARPDGAPTIRDSKGAPVGCNFFGQSSFAFHSVASERSLVVVDAETEDELALLAPLGCGIQAGAGTVINELKPGEGASIAVFGAGTVGLSALMAARMLKASPIAAIDVAPTRLEMARELGADLVIDAGRENVGKRLGEVLGPVRYAVETTGIFRVIEQAKRSLAPRGSLSLLGVSEENPNGSEGLERARPGPDQRIFYSIAGDSDPQKFIPFLIRNFRAGNFPYRKLIREYPALKINEAVRDSISGVTIKPLLRFC